jgi:hypothetical protein
MPSVARENHRSYSRKMRCDPIDNESLGPTVCQVETPWAGPCYGTVSAADSEVSVGS